jgi:hypothetical protein
MPNTNSSKKRATRTTTTTTDSSSDPARIAAVCAGSRTLPAQVNVVRCYCN